MTPNAGKPVDPGLIAYHERVAFQETRAGQILARRDCLLDQFDLSCPPTLVKKCLKRTVQPQ